MRPTSVHGVLAAAVVCTLLTGCGGDSSDPRAEVASVAGDVLGAVARGDATSLCGTLGPQLRRRVIASARSGRLFIEYGRDTCEDGLFAVGLTSGRRPQPLRDPEKVPHVPLDQVRVDGDRATVTPDVRAFPLAPRAQFVRLDDRWRLAAIDTLGPRAMQESVAPLSGADLRACRPASLVALIEDDEKRYGRRAGLLGRLRSGDVYLVVVRGGFGCTAVAEGRDRRVTLFRRPPQSAGWSRWFRGDDLDVGQRRRRNVTAGGTTLRPLVVGTKRSGRRP